MAGKLMCWAGQHFHDFSADVLDALVSVIGSTICRMFNKVPSSYSSNSSNSSSASPPSSEYFLTEQQCIIPSQSWCIIKIWEMRSCHPATFCPPPPPPPCLILPPPHGNAARSISGIEVKSFLSIYFFSLRKFKWIHSSLCLSLSLSVSPCSCPSTFTTHFADYSEVLIKFLTDPW